MRFFRILSKLNFNEILKGFNDFSELESHNIFTSLFESYNSPRIGIHSYTSENKVWGYYETGELDGRKIGLISFKNWFFITLKKQKNRTVVRGFIIGDIYVMGGIYIPIVAMLFDFLKYQTIDKAFYFILTVLLFGLIILKEYKNQIKLYDEILSIVGNTQ